MEDIKWLIVYLAGTDVRMIQGSAPERKVNACGANSVYSGHDVDQDVLESYKGDADSTVGQKDGWRVLAPASRTNNCSTRFGPEDAFQLGQAQRVFHRVDQFRLPERRGCLEGITVKKQSV